MNRSEATELPEAVETRPMRTHDFDALRMLLVDTVRTTAPGFNWEVRRLDGKSYHSEQPGLDAEFLRGSAVWLTRAGRIVAAVHPEARGEAYIQLEPQIVTHGCRYLSEGEPRALEIEVQEYDELRAEILTRAGFIATESTTALRRMRFGRQVIRTPEIDSSYTVRTTRRGDPEDCRRIAALLNAAFGRDSHTGREIEQFHSGAPSFREDLDLVAEATGGGSAVDEAFAAHVGIAWDAANGQAVFEPVCTHPDHRRRGLAAALMLEGMHRLRARGAADALVGTGDAVAANRLYASLGFTETYRGRMWKPVASEAEQDDAVV